MLQEEVFKTDPLPKTIRWLQALSQTDLNKLLAYAQSELFPIRKETQDSLANIQSGQGYEALDRVTMGKIHTDIRKFLALMAFGDQLTEAVHTNFWMLKAMRSRLKKSGDFAKVGFEWEIYDSEVRSFRNKAEKEGEWKKLAETDSEYLSIKSEEGKWSEQDDQIAKKRDQAVDNDYLISRLRSLAVSLTNSQRVLDKAQRRQQQAAILENCIPILEFAKKLPVQKGPNLQFYISYTDFLIGRVKANAVEPQKVKWILSLFEHPDFLLDQIAGGLAYTVVLEALNDGKFEFYRPLYDFLRKGIESGKILDLKGRIPLPYYRTLTQTGLLAKKEKELKHLLPLWKEGLAAPPAKREALFKHCLALVLLKEGKYKSAWEISREAKFSTPNFLWYHAELQFRIQYEAEFMGKPILSDQEKGWEDTREELIEEMTKLVREVSRTRNSAQSNLFSIRTEMYRILDQPALTMNLKRRKIKELASGAITNELDLEWFARMLNAEAEFLRPRT